MLVIFDSIILIASFHCYFFIILWLLLVIFYLHWGTHSFYSPNALIFITNSSFLPTLAISLVFSLAICHILCLLSINFVILFWVNRLFLLLHFLVGNYYFCIYYCLLRDDANPRIFYCFMPLFCLIAIWAGCFKVVFFWIISVHVIFIFSWQPIVPELFLLQPSDLSPVSFHVISAFTIFRVDLFCFWQYR